VPLPAVSHATAPAANTNMIAVAIHQARLRPGGPSPDEPFTDEAPWLLVALTLCRGSRFELAIDELVSDAQRGTKIIRPRDAAASLPCRENHFPILLHVRHRPFIDGRGVQRLVEFSKLGVAIIGIFPLGIGVVDDQTKTSAA
jgi:hypothetical protein